MSRRTVVFLLIAAGILQLGFVAIVHLHSWWLERTSRDLTRRDAATGTIGRADRARHDAVATGRIGHLEIARLGVEAPLTEGVDGPALLDGVGHVPHTAFPGERDNLALAGHRDTHLAQLRRVERGDRIRIDTADGVFYYEVDTSFVVPPTRADLLDPTGRPMITLVTCWPFHWIGPAPKRFIVRGHAIAGDTAST